MKILILVFIGSLGSFQNVIGHGMLKNFIIVFNFNLIYKILNEFISGAMYYPSPWHATSDCTPDMSPKDCKFDLKVPSDCTGRCSRTAYLKGWFTNFTVIPGDATLPDEMYDQWVPRESSGAGLHPWNAPGTAPTFGNGCGVNGGNPNGCDGEGRIKHHALETFYF